ncbi:MAG: hydrogenase 3 maturation endopeptidase HyCI [Anaerolineales bacterium]
MPSQTWQASLRASLNPPNRSDTPVRLAVVGIGHELCGDDAVGMRLAGMLRPYAAGQERLLVVEAGPAPENFTGPLRRFKPDLVLLVDAAQMSAEPGQIGWLDLPGTDGISASSHTLPLHILVSYLEAELGCRVALIGIQPEQTFADAPLTGRVQAAAQEVVQALLESL